MCPGFQEPPNAGPVQRFLSLSSSLAFCACEERVFLSVLFSLLFSSSFSVVAFVVFVALSPPPTFPRRLCAVFFHFAFSYWGRRRHRGRRGHSCLFFSPSFPLPCGSISLSTISSIRLFCQWQIFAHFHGNHRFPGCFLLLS